MTQQNGGSDEEVDLREVWNILRRNRWLILGCFLLCTAVAVAYAVLATPVYEAATSIRIDDRRASIPVLDVLRTFSPANEVDTEMEVLRSRTLAEEVVDSLGLQLKVAAPRRAPRNQLFHSVRVSSEASHEIYRLERQGGGRFTVFNVGTGATYGTYSPGQQIELEGVAIILAATAVEYSELRLAITPLEDALKLLQERIRVERPNRMATVVVVRYQSPDTFLVRTIPNILAQRFIARRLEVQRSGASSTVNFLRQQIDTLSTQLIAAEESLRTFREKHQVVSLEAEASTQVRELAGLQAQRNQLDAERVSLNGLLDAVRAAAVTEPDGPSPYRRLIGFPSLLRNQAASELLRSLNAVENEHAELLRRRTPKDPDAQLLAARIRELEEQLRGIASAYLQSLSNQVDALDATLARAGRQLATIPAKEVHFARLKRETMVLEEIYTLLQTRLKEAEVAQAVDDASVRVIDTAARPSLPIKPNKRLLALVGIVLGLMVGVAVALLREFMDTTVHTREDIQEITSVPLLGLIPRIRGTTDRNGIRPRRFGRKPVPEVDVQGLEARLVTGNDPRNPVSEAYRSLRTNITFARPEQTPKTLVFTSPTPGDGKSTTSANLAITLAQQGLKVLLIDADMRRGVLNGVFRLDREPGLSNVLVGHTPLETALRAVGLGTSGAIDFLPTGTLPPNPAELLSSERMRGLLEQLEQTYDAVILDAPPLNLVTDAALLGSNADGVILVARASVTEKGALAYALEQLRNVRALVLGAVLNDIDYKRDARYYGRYGSYGYYYQYYYGQTEER